MIPRARGLEQPADRNFAPHAPADADTPTETFEPHADQEWNDGLPRDATPYTASRRGDGWSADRQRRFLEALAEGAGVEVACARVGLSAASAYAFRRSARGAAFALGWRAATLVARDSIAETLMVRALHGHVETVIRGDVVVTRHKFDNRLAMTLLARLDRQVESAPDADVKAACIVAQDFDAFLDVVGQGQSPAHAGLFLARRGGLVGEGEAAEGGAAEGDARDLAPILALAAADRMVRTGVSTAAEVPVDDLDPIRRAEWTAEQWVRAEAAGLVALAPPEPAPPTPDAPAEPEPAAARTAPAPQLPQHWGSDPVWYDDLLGEWYTSFPPPEGFDGEEAGTFGDKVYERTLTDEERALTEAWYDREAREDLASEEQTRDEYFDVMRAAIGAAPPSDPAAPPSCHPGEGRGPAGEAATMENAPPPPASKPPARRRGKAVQPAPA